MPLMSNRQTGKKFRRSDARERADAAPVEAVQRNFWKSTDGEREEWRGGGH